MLKDEDVTVSDMSVPPRAGDQSPSQVEPLDTSLARVPQALDMPKVPTCTNVTVMNRVAPALREKLWAMYTEAFARLEQVTLVRQDLSRGEFDELLADTDTFKLLGIRDGEPLGLMVITREIDRVPSLNSAFLRNMYPDHAATNSIFYTVFGFSNAGRRGLTLYSALVSAAADLVVENNGVMILDMSRFHQRAGLNNLIERVARNVPRSFFGEVDAQVYYAVGVPAEASSTEDVDDGVTIDLTDSSIVGVTAPD